MEAAEPLDAARDIRAVTRRALDQAGA